MPAVREGVRDDDLMRWRDEPVELVLASVDEYLCSASPSVAEALRGPLDASDAMLVAIDVQARASAWDHVSGGWTERGGLLVGRACVRSSDDPRIALVHVRDAVPSEARDATAISLRMEAQVWSAARERLRGGEMVVGWFHSHPRIGAFFSDTDRATQAAFFRHAFSLGWVIDPVREEEAWFAGADAAPVAPRALVTLPAT